MGATESIQIPVEETGSLSPEQQVEAQATDRPDYLPEKFNSPEEMAKAYAELESKLGSGDTTETETTNDLNIGYI